jgi:hypothetical protein
MDVGIGFDFTKNVGSQTRAPGTAGSGPDTALWHAIRDFPLDDPDASMPFSARLARDHLWTPDYARKVVAEYRRFLYLLATEPEMMTPSEDVDEAWHLHLAYSKSYWDDLCGRVLLRPLHHNPTGGNEDSPGFSVAYERTLNRYRSVFGTDPPVDVWPSTFTRFDVASGFRTVPLRDFRVVGRLLGGGFGKAFRILVAGACFVAIPLLAVAFDLSFLVYVASCVVLTFFGFLWLHVLSDVALPAWGQDGLGFAKYRTDPEKGGSNGCGGGCGGCGGCG